MSEDVVEQSAVEEPKRDLGFVQYHEQMRAKCSHGWKDDVEPEDLNEQKDDSVDRTQS